MVFIKKVEKKSNDHIINMENNHDWLLSLKALHTILNKFNFPEHCLRPKQVECIDYMLLGFDVMGILPTGYGKSFIYQTIGMALKRKCTSADNIVLVVTPLNSIIEDQLGSLAQKGVTAGCLKLLNEINTIEDLFPPSENDTLTTNDCVITNEIRRGDFQILFGHPEAFLSTEGRILLRSKPYQRRVAACVIDEMHCVELWGKDFRTDFQELSSLRAIFPDSQFLALTATATNNLIALVKETLSFDDSSCKIVKASPNKKLIFFAKKLRLPSNTGLQSFGRILAPIAHDLKVKKEEYPITIIYMTLKYCGYAYKLFERILGNQQYVDGICNPSHHLFCQFHSPQTTNMKSDTLLQLKSDKSNIRVVFATTALGMGVDASHVKEVIHISPPSTLEYYLQAVGRAGRDGEIATATLYYNKSDISLSTNINDAMRNYCEVATCLRKQIMNYFGFKHEIQERCCSVCDQTFTNKEVTKEDTVEKDFDLDLLRKTLSKVVDDWKLEVQAHSINAFASEVVPDDLVKIIINNANNIQSEAKLLELGIWDQTVSSKIFKILRSFNFS